MKFKVGVLIFLMSTNAFCFECEKEKILMEPPAKPSKQALLHAVEVFERSPELGKCLYPDVTVKARLVGEHENKADALAVVTIRNREVYSWGAYSVQVGYLDVPEDMDLTSVKDQYSNSYRLIAVTSEDGQAKEY